MQALTKEIESTSKLYEPGDLEATFKRNQTKIEDAFKEIENAVTNAPDSVKQLNGIFSEELSRMFTEAQKRPDPEQADKYAKWDVNTQVNKQLVNFLFLSVVNPALTNTISMSNPGDPVAADQAKTLTKTLQLAVNNDANNLLAGRKVEQSYVQNLHTRMLAFTEKAQVKAESTPEAAPEEVKAQNKDTENISQRAKTSRSIPPPPNYAAPSPPTKKQAVESSQSANARFDEVLNTYANNIAKSTTTEELASLKERLTILENRTGNEQRKDEIKELKRLLDEKMVIRTRLEEIQKKKFPT